MKPCKNARISAQRLPSSKAVAAIYNLRDTAHLTSSVPFLFYLQNCLIRSLRLKFAQYTFASVST
jgi:hypothetical protein